MIADTATNRLSQDLLRLGRMVRCAPSFMDVVRWWAGFHLRGEQALEPTTQPLSRQGALLLDLPAGTPVLRRKMRLVGASAGPVVMVATVTEYVHEPLLGSDLTARRALRDGALPVDVLLDGLHRAAYLITRPVRDLDDQPDELPVLISRTVLSGAGRPVALTTEVIHRQLLTYRSPQTIPHYAAQMPRAARTAL